jgi:hypothetical protein
MAISHLNMWIFSLTSTANFTIWTKQSLNLVASLTRFRSVMVHHKLWRSGFFMKARSGSFIKAFVDLKARVLPVFGQRSLSIQGGILTIE